MNRVKQILLTLILIMLLCFTITSCGSDDGQKTGGNNAITGNWEMTGMSTGNSQVSAEDYLKSADVSKLPMLTFESDGKVTFEVDGDSGSGTWAEENGKYTIHYKAGDKESTKEVALDGSTLTMEQDGYRLSYEKR